MKTLAAYKSGEIINWNGYKWIVIDYDENSKILLMKDILEDRPFEDNDDNPTNNWKECSLRKYLNEDFYNKLDDKEYMLDYESDLKADNGDDDYGTSIDKIFLISMDFYRNHRKEIRLTNDLWWTITPYTLNAYRVRVVVYTEKSTAIYNYDCGGSHGVRPACLVSSTLLVDSEQIDSDDESEKNEKCEDLSEHELLFFQQGKIDMLHEMIDHYTRLLEKMEKEKTGLLKGIEIDEE